MADKSLESPEALTVGLLEQRDKIALQLIEIITGLSSPLNVSPKETLDALMGTDAARFRRAADFVLKMMVTATKAAMLEPGA